jgi:hypothetical protein
MSLDTIIAKHLGKKLFRLESLYTGDETGREVMVSADVSAATMPPFPDTLMGERLAELRAWLDAFLELSEITVSEDPDHKPPDVMLARVNPIREQFWSCRITLPAQTPGIRAIGGFNGKDKFIALTWDFREDIVDFDGNVELAIEYWKELFGEQKPFRGNNLDEYLTNYRAV